MREVFGERGIPIRVTREPLKTDRIRGWSLTAKPTKIPVNKGRTDKAPYPHRGDRGGDTLKWATTRLTNHCPWKKVRAKLKRGTIPPVWLNSTSADHGFTQEPRAILQSRT